MNKNKLIDTLNKLRVIMKFCPAKSAEEIAILVNEYYDELKQYSDYIFENAVQNIKKHENEFPTIATMQFYCKKFYAEETDRLNGKWLGLRDALKTDNKPTKEQFDELAKEWLRIGNHNQATFVKQYYEEFKDYKWQPPDPKKVEAFKNKLKGTLDKLEVKE